MCEVFQRFTFLMLNYLCRHVTLPKVWFTHYQRVGLRIGFIIVMASNLVVIGTGSQAACNIAGLASELPHNIVVILTEAALRFITKDTIRNVGNVEIVLDDQSPQMAKLPNHIWASEFADLTVVYPASAGFIGKMANGLALDVASTVILASEPTKVLVYPSMHQKMWEHPGVVENMKTLGRAGFIVSASRNGQAPAVDVVVAEVNRIITR